MGTGWPLSLESTGTSVYRWSMTDTIKMLSSIAKWLPMQPRGPSPKGFVVMRHNLVLVLGKETFRAKLFRTIPVFAVAMQGVSPRVNERSLGNPVTVIDCHCSVIGSIVRLDHGWLRLISPAFSLLIHCSGAGSLESTEVSMKSVFLALLVLAVCSLPARSEVLKGGVEESAVIEGKLSALRPKWAEQNLVEHCSCINPHKVRAVELNGRWQLTDESQTIADFSFDKAGADAAVTVLKHYGFTQTCWAGHPSSNGMHDMQYFKTPEGAPAGALAGEDAIDMNPEDVKTEMLKGSWKVTCGDNWLMDFGQDQAAAEQARDIIHLYGFSKQCFVGNPNRVLMYFRK